MNRWSWQRVNVEVLLGKTLTCIEQKENEELRFFTSDGEEYLMFHDQDCCEEVVLEEVVGEFADLINSPILMAEVVTEEHDKQWDHETWTFYKFATVKGYVTLRWVGSSNGYYSEEVDFKRVPKS